MDTNSWHPPRSCHWKVFAQIVASFGLLTEVDWSTPFKSFYETVRVKIACKDYKKIPQERLYEMNKKLYVVNFTVEADIKKDETKQGTDGDDGDGGGGDDDQKGADDDEADDLFDTDDDGEP